MTVRFSRPGKLLRRTGKRIGAWLLRANYALVLPPLRGYAVCATARSGSSYLCELLSSTGRLGVPTEYFSQSAMLWRDRSYPADPRLQVEAVKSIGATRNGIYGAKIFNPHLAALQSVVDPLRDLPNLKFVRLRRRDRLGQAISLVRAEQTGKFGSRRPSVPPGAYDPAQIRAGLARIAEQEAQWDRILADLGATPIEIEYEAMMLDPQAAVDRVAGLMGLRAGAPIRWRQVASKVQRDEFSVDWRRRFLADTGEEFRHLADSVVAQN